MREPPGKDRPLILPIGKDYPLVNPAWQGFINLSVSLVKGAPVLASFGLADICAK